MSTRPPAWKETAQEHATPPEGALSLQQVAERTALKPSTVLTAVYSTMHTGNRSRMRQLARPRYNVAGTPYWHPDQVADYHAQVQRRFTVVREFPDLPKVNKQTAVQLQATSLHGLSRLSDVPVTTLHRWKIAEGWPKPAALMEVSSPTPSVLYPWPAVREHMLQNHANWFAARGITAAQLRRRNVTMANV
jgi:hypothetical protein